VWNPSDIIGDSMSHGWGANVSLEIQMALLGVRPSAPGLAAFTVAPPPATALTHASGIVPSPQGPISVSWQRAHGFTLGLTVPPNASARVRIPAASESAVTEGGQPLAQAVGVRFVKVDGPDVLLEVGAGTYKFRAS